MVQNMMNRLLTSYMTSGKTNKRNRCLNWHYCNIIQIIILAPLIDLGYSVEIPQAAFNMRTIRIHTTK